ncbi:hypothetical protein Q5P01_003505 [Channa striata]|uniref:Uncharacterized protein n=1 Tax=Channa striata TaxID=64152 RepID=A0AA88T2S4_CHASR|nr:hypothetical protein Q5P01_003505 [Channa striata]
MSRKSCEDFHTLCHFLFSEGGSSATDEGTANGRTFVPAMAAPKMTEEKADFDVSDFHFRRRSCKVLL